MTNTPTILRMSLEQNYGVQTRTNYLASKAKVYS